MLSSTHGDRKSTRGRAARSLVGLAGALSVALVCLAAPRDARAQLRGCFETVEAASWVGSDVDLDVPGASRPLPGGAPADFELCSQSAGFGDTSDAFRYLHQDVDGDFTLTARLETIDTIGAAGLMVRREAREAGSGHVRIVVQRRERDSFLLRSHVRSTSGESVSSEGAAGISVSLPITLRIRRDGHIVTTSYSAGGPFIDHLVFDSEDTDLDSGRLEAGMAQTSANTESAAGAIFVRASVESDSPPPPNLDCIDSFTTVLPSDGGVELHLSGSFPEPIRRVTLAGVEARVVEQTLAGVTVVASPLGALGASTTRSGDLVVETASGQVDVIPDAITYAGESFIRGDANHDRTVDLADALYLLRHLFLRGPGPYCPDAADANGDKAGDIGDPVFLLLHLFVGDFRIPPPYPDPGLPDEPGPPCGWEERVAIESILGPDDSPIDATTAIATGDVLTILGSGFPERAESFAVLFEEVETEILPGSSARSLRVRIGEVPADGARCPTLFLYGDSAATAEGIAASERPLQQRLGRALTLDPEDTGDAVCPMFVTTRSSAIPVASIRDGARRGVKLLSFDRQSVTPRDEIEIHLQLLRRPIHGLSRGSRRLRFSFYNPPQDVRDPDEAFRIWLERLARRLNIELNGTDDEDCGCEQRARAVPGEGAVALEPCIDIADDIVGPYGPGPGPDPPPPEPGLPLKAPRGPLVHGSGFKYENPCPDIENIPLDQPRKLAWCRFSEVTAPHPQYSDLPKWEFFIPISAVLGSPSAVANLEFPTNRPESQKRTTYNLSAYEHVRYTTAYFRPCVPTANFLTCQSGLSHWMQPFPPSAIIFKGFWRRHDRLPESADPDDYYSYDPPNASPRYLVGMHLSTKDLPNQNSGTTSWLWATFFVPPPPGDTLDKAGRPLSETFHTDCQVGHRNDIPDDVVGVWRNFVLCTNDEGSGSHACGNPWGPTDECETLTCDSCHTAVGQITYPEPVAGLSSHQLQWLGSLKPAPSITDDCYEAVQAGIADDDISEWIDFLTPGCGD